MKSSLAGKRIDLARKARGRSLKELAISCKVEVNTIQKWILYGIPLSKVSRVAEYFKVEDWVFLDKRLKNDDVINIVRDPDLMNKYRPTNEIKRRGPTHLITFRGSYLDSSKDNSTRDVHVNAVKVQGRKTGKIFKSPPFHIISSSIQIVIRVWGMQSPSQTHCILCDKSEEDLPAALRSPSSQFTVTTNKDFINETDGCVQKEILNRPFNGYYYLSIFSAYNFEVEIYDVN